LVEKRKGVIIRLGNPEHAPAGRRVPEDDAVGRDSKQELSEEETAFGPDTIETAMRTRIRETIERLVDEELEVALGAKSSQRVEARRGYRHGARARTLTTSLGPTTFTMPRARVGGDDGQRTEWRSQLIGRYERRTARVDEALLGVYLAGTNTRRIRGALAPLLRGGPLSKDAVSRLVGRLREDFAAWRTRDLAADQFRYLFLDGWYPKVRIGKKRVRVPVLVTLGVRATGERVVVDLRLAGAETAAAWGDVVDALVGRQVGKPTLAVIDGNPGLHAALRAQWPKLPIQRCTNHKGRNLLAKAPASLREELAEDYRRMIYAETREQVEKARGTFRKKWQLRCPAVVTSLDEAGDDLFTFLDFPAAQWKALRTTNALERINGEFRRRTKTQASLPGEDAVLLLLFGLLRSGAITLRRLVGYDTLAAPSARQKAA
jgi:transposase-like protein